MKALLGFMVMAAVPGTMWMVHTMVSTAAKQLLLPKLTKWNSPHSFLFPSRSSLRSFSTFTLKLGASAADDRTSRSPSQFTQSSQQSPLEQIMQHCRATGNFSQLMSYVADMESHSDALYTARFMATVIRYLDEARQLGKAISMLSFMKRRQIPVNEYHFSALINSARKAGQWEMALELFQSMGRFNISCNTVVYNTLLTTLGEARQEQAILEVVQSMTSSGVNMDVITYTAIVTALVRCGSWRRAVRIYEDIRHSIPANTMLLNAILRGYADGKELGLAFSLILDMHQRGVEPDIATYSTLIGICGECRRLDMAFAIFDTLFHKQPMTALNNLAASQHRTVMSTDVTMNMSSLAINVDKTAEMYEGDAVTYAALISACEKCNRPDLALQVLDLIVSRRARVVDKSTGHIRTIYPNVQAFGAAMTACSNSGLLTELMSLYNSMTQLGISKDKVTYQTVIGALQKEAQRQEAKRLILGDSMLVPHVGRFNASHSYQELAQKVFSDGLSCGVLYPFASPFPNAARAAMPVRIDQFKVCVETIDLHGYQCLVAIASIDYVFNKIAYLAATNTTGLNGTCSIGRSLKVITGRGNHINNSGERGTVKATIERHILDKIEPSGVLQIERIAGNDGAFFVTQDSINAWILARSALLAPN